MDPAGVVIGDVDLRLGKWVNSTRNLAMRLVQKHHIAGNFYSNLSKPRTLELLQQYMCTTVLPLALIPWRLCYSIKIYTLSKLSSCLVNHVCFGKFQWNSGWKKSIKGSSLEDIPSPCKLPGVWLSSKKSGSQFFWVLLLFWVSFLSPFGACK